MLCAIAWVYCERKSHRDSLTASAMEKRVTNINVRASVKKRTEHPEHRTANTARERERKRIFRMFRTSKHDEKFWGRKSSRQNGSIIRNVYFRRCRVVVAVAVVFFIIFCLMRSVCSICSLFSATAFCVTRFFGVRVWIRCRASKS